LRLSVVIVSYNVRHFLELCLHSVTRAAEGLDAEIIVVDNASADDSVAMVQARFPAVQLIANRENTGFARANNQAVAVARGAYILFLNPDTVMPEDFLRTVLDWMDAHPEAGALGPRLIDGRGTYAPDGKKRFPTFWVAVAKSLGLGKLAPRSGMLNGYYAPEVDERQTAPVEVLSGCCMVVRTDAMRKAGGAFDEDYFMYCEDVDLSWRIRGAGYQNIYFPQVDLVHYKGESTRKATLSYIRIFNRALATFVRKHYTRGAARAFTGLLRAGIAARAVLGALRNAFRALRMPLFDALVLLTVLWAMVEFWVRTVKDIPRVPLRLLVLTFPVYVGAWIGSLFLNGAYDRPYRALRVVRGMLMGTVVALAFYGLLPKDARYSRAVVLFGGLAGTVALLGLHELGRRLGIFRLVTPDALPRPVLVVSADRARYTAAVQLLEGVRNAPRPLGWVVAGGADSSAATADGVTSRLGTLPDLPALLHTTGAAGAVYCADDRLPYSAILESMQACGPRYEYRIHVPGATALVGSSSLASAAELLTDDPRYNLSTAAHRRAKRLFDVASALLLILLSPLVVWRTARPAAAVGNALAVLAGRKTWVGYSAARPGLPSLKPGVVPPYFLLEDYTAPEAVRATADAAYARNHEAGTDALYLWRNFRFLGGVS